MLPDVVNLTFNIFFLFNSIYLGIFLQDLHSRKGLEGMLEQRKKLLKYLRRTDWDEYCVLITRLGLRDRPNEVR